MIFKTNKIESTKLNTILGLKSYLVHGRLGEEIPICERVKYCIGINTKNDDYDVCFDEIVHSARLNQSSKTSSYCHYTLSLRDGEHLSVNEWNDCVKTLMKDLGIADHIAIAVVHHDSDQEHCHIVVSKVNPNTRKRASLSFEKIKGNETCKKLEEKYKIVAPEARFTSEKINSMQRYKNGEIKIKEYAEHIKNEFKKSLSNEIDSLRNASSIDEIKEILKSKKFSLEAITKGKSKQFIFGYKIKNDMTGELLKISALDNKLAKHIKTLKRSSLIKQRTKSLIHYKTYKEPTERFKKILPELDGLIYLNVKDYRNIDLFFKSKRLLENRVNDEIAVDLNNTKKRINALNQKASLTCEEMRFCRQAKSRYGDLLNLKLVEGQSIVEKEKKNERYQFSVKARNWNNITGAWEEITDSWGDLCQGWSKLGFTNFATDRRSEQRIEKMHMQGLFKSDLDANVCFKPRLNDGTKLKSAANKDSKEKLNNSLHMLRNTTTDIRIGESNNNSNNNELFNNGITKEKTWSFSIGYNYFENATEKEIKDLVDEGYYSKEEVIQALPEQAGNEIFRTQTTKENTKGNSRCSTKSI